MISHDLVTPKVWGYLSPILDRGNYEPSNRVFIHHPGAHNPDMFCVETRNERDREYYQGMIALAKSLAVKAKHRRHARKMGA